MMPSAPLSLVTGASTGNDDRGRLINSIGSLPHGFAGLNECATMATFVDHRQLGTYMSSLNSHPKTSSTTSSRAQIQGRVSLPSKITASYSASAPRTHLWATCGFFPSRQICTHNTSPVQPIEYLPQLRSQCHLYHHHSRSSIEGPSPPSPNLLNSSPSVHVRCRCFVSKASTTAPHTCLAATLQGHHYQLEVLSCAVWSPRSCITVIY
jgi:hypothetical protein